VLLFAFCVLVWAKKYFYCLLEFLKIYFLYRINKIFGVGKLENLFVLSVKLRGLSLIFFVINCDNLWVEMVIRDSLMF
jgi:hypothetical protein